MGPIRRTINLILALALAVIGLPAPVANHWPASPFEYDAPQRSPRTGASACGSIVWGDASSSRFSRHTLRAHALHRAEREHAAICAKFSEAISGRQPTLAHP